MNTPGFAAEASLYETSGRYRSSAQTINLPPQISSPINAVIMAYVIGPGENCKEGEFATYLGDGYTDCEGEVISLTGCPPGYVEFGVGIGRTCEPVGDGGDGGDGGGNGAGREGDSGGGGGGGGAGSGKGHKPPQPQGQDAKYADKTCFYYREDGSTSRGPCKTTCLNKVVKRETSPGADYYCGNKPQPIIPPVHFPRTAGFGV